MCGQVGLYGLIDFAEEGDKVFSPMLLLCSGDDLPGGHVDGCEEVERRELEAELCMADIGGCPKLEPTCLET